MASSTGSKVSLLIVGAMSLAALSVSTINTIKDSLTPAQTNRAAIFTGDSFYLTTEDASPDIRLNNTQYLSYTGAGLAFRKSGISTGATLLAMPATQSGVTTTADSHPLVTFKAWHTLCSGSGGLAKYPYCLVEQPFTTTGAITKLELQCGNTNKTLLMSGGLVKSSTQGVGVFTGGLIRLNDITVGTGSVAPASLSGGLILWNTADLIKFQTITTPQTLANGGGNDCAVYIEAHQIKPR